MSKKIIGVDPIPVPDKLLLDYNIKSKKIVMGYPEDAFWVTDGVFIEDPVERMKMEKMLKEITKYFRSKVSLSNSIFCFTEFEDKDNWRAVRIHQIKKDANVYAPMMWGLTGSAEIVMKNGVCNISYFTKDCITEKLIG